MKRIFLYSLAASVLITGSSLVSHQPVHAGKAHISKSPLIPHSIHDKRKIQVALLMDTSSSMDGLIEQAKSQLWKIVNELATAEYNGEKPSIEIALYHYGNDGLSASKNYIQQMLPFTTDLDKVSEELFKLQTNGGNEYCGAVIQDASTDLSWSNSNEDLKLIYIAGNEPFNQGSVDYQKACREAIKKGIIVNTIYCGTESEGVNSGWKEGAQLADGEFASINMNEATVYVSTPFDTTLIRLNSELNSTYVFYGTDGKVASTNQRKQDANAGAYSVSNVAERTVSKASSGYVNKDWDLVDASKEANFDMKKVKTEDLPDEMKNMSDDERKKYVADQHTKRENIKTQINDINLKRQEYIDAENAKNGQENSLEKALVTSVRKVATEKNYTFK